MGILPFIKAALNTVIPDMPGVLDLPAKRGGKRFAREIRERTRKKEKNILPANNANDREWEGIFHHSRSFA